MIVLSVSVALLVVLFVTVPFVLSLSLSAINSGDGLDTDSKTKKTGKT